MKLTKIKNIGKKGKKIKNIGKKGKKISLFHFLLWFWSRVVVGLRIKLMLEGWSTVKDFVSYLGYLQTCTVALNPKKKKKKLYKTSKEKITHVQAHYRKKIFPLMSRNKVLRPSSWTLLMKIRDIRNILVSLIT